MSLIEEIFLIVSVHFKNRPLTMLTLAFRLKLAIIPTDRRLCDPLLFLDTLSKVDMLENVFTSRCNNPIMHHRKCVHLVANCD